MLHAFELHDGSIIKIGGHHKARTVRCLDPSVNKGGARVVAFHESDGLAFLKECEGEPLSEDWLLRFTFIDRGKEAYNSTRYAFDYQFEHERAFNVLVRENSAGRKEFWWATYDYNQAIEECDWTDRVKLDFVHELQNLFQSMEKKPLTIKAK